MKKIYETNNLARRIIENTDQCLSGWSPKLNQNMKAFSKEDKTLSTAISKKNKSVPNFEGIKESAFEGNDYYPLAYLHDFDSAKAANEYYSSVSRVADQYGCSLHDEKEYLFLHGSEENIQKVIESLGSKFDPTEIISGNMIDEGSDSLENHMW